MVPARWNVAFVTELFVLAITAPVLYLPQRFELDAVLFAGGLLAASWLWRRLWTGVWYAATPADWPIILLVVVMLPVAVWAAPDPLRTQYAWPRALVLLWNLHLFIVFVTYASRQRRLLTPLLLIFLGSALLIALLAPLGVNWLYKLPGVQLILSHVPALLGFLSREGESGFHPNIVAGALLYALPLMIALAVAGLRRQPRNRWLWLLAGTALYTTGVFFLLQSRGGYIGLAVALTVMVALPHRWGRWLLALGTVSMVVLTTTAGGNMLLTWVADNPTVEAVGGTVTLTGFRVEVWTAALLAIQDFPFTGAGLGTFQEVAMLLYPLNVSPTYYFGHAHNFWLQGAIDFGIPGLIAITAIYLAAIVQAARLWRAPLVPPGLAAGLAGSLLAQSIFSLTDAIPLGSTANLFFWMLFGLILAVGNLTFGGGIAPKEKGRTR